MGQDIDVETKFETFQIKNSGDKLGYTDPMFSLPIQYLRPGVCWYWPDYLSDQCSLFPKSKFIILHCVELIGIIFYVSQHEARDYCGM